MKSANKSKIDWIDIEFDLFNVYSANVSDIVCLQEVSELSFDEDFSFLVAAGYEALMHNKKGRMRPATFWRQLYVGQLLGHLLSPPSQFL